MIAAEPVTSYTELIGAIHAEVEKLGVRSLDFDELAGFAPGLSGKVFGLLQVRQLRLEKVFDALRAAGLRLRIEVDPEQQAKMKARIASNFIPRQANQARPGHSASLPSQAVLSRILTPIGKIGGQKRWHKTSKAERSAHMRMMAMAGVRKRRKKAKRAKQAQRRGAAHRAANAEARAQ